MYVCMYVCIYSGMHMYVGMFVCMDVCMYVCMYVWMYGCMYVCMYIAFSHAWVTVLDWAPQLTPLQENTFYIKRTHSIANLGHGIRLGPSAYSFLHWGGALRLSHSFLYMHICTYAYVCMYVCICMYVCTHIWGHQSGTLPVNMRIHTSLVVKTLVVKTRIYGDMRVVHFLSTCVCVRRFMYVIYVMRTWVCVRRCMWTCVCVRWCMWTCACVRRCVRTCVCVRRCMCVREASMIMSLYY